MATIGTLGENDTGSDSRTTINTNFDNLNTDKIETSVISTDGTLAGNSDTELPTEKAVKTYVDANSISAASGVGAPPATSTTQTVTHGLGTIPSVIRINAVGDMLQSGVSNANSVSMGTYTSSGNRCVYCVPGAPSAGATSTTFAVYVGSATGSSNIDHYATGVINNVTATDFDIVWTVSADSTDLNYMWEVNV